MSERKEGWMRIIVAIVTGIILGVWKMFIAVLFVVNWLVVVCAGKRIKDLAELSDTWNTQLYHFLKYMTFVTNHRPFPFNRLEKNMSKYEK